MRKFIVIALLCFAGAAAAAPGSAPDQLLQQLTGTNQIGKVYPLPTAGGLVAFVSDGRLYIMSKNGRFLIDGRVHDLWHNGVTLDSLADVKKYALRLDLDALGVEFDKLVTVRIGHGAQKATMFVAANCKACAKALQTVKALGGIYTTRVVVVPRGRTIAALRQVDCAAEQANRMRLLEMLLDPMARVATGEGSPACAGSEVRMTSTLMAARLVGALHVPFIINPQGRISRGLPQNQTVADFLANKPVKTQRGGQ